MNPFNEEQSLIGVNVITEDEAWNLCAEVGKPAPYLGYAVDLKDGSLVRQVRMANGERRFELLEPECPDLMPCDPPEGANK